MPSDTRPQLTRPSSPVTIRAAEAADFPQLLELLRGKARFDGGAHLLRAEPAQLQEAFFGGSPMCEVLVAEHEAELVGFATHHPTFSTYLARPGIWLDDLFVRHEHRSRGIGLLLIRELSRIASERGCARIEWSVATSNVRGIAFYERIGARLREDGRLARLDHATMAELGSG